MAFDKTGKYHMNPHHAKMADAAPPKDAGAPPAHDAMPDADEGSDQEPVMMTCPACGDTFPMEEGLAHSAAQPVAAGHGAAPTHESGHGMSLGGY